MIGPMYRAAALLVSLTWMAPFAGCGQGGASGTGAPPVPAQLEWTPFTLDSFQQHLEQGHTVLVDFTADW